jgi:hypothetical protein
MAPFIAALVIIIGFIVVLLPVKMAAVAMGAKRSGFAWCFLALLAAIVLHSVGLGAPVLGTVVAFLLASAGFAAILGTSFLRGIGIAILQTIFSFVVLFVASLLLGFSWLALVGL